MRVQTVFALLVLTLVSFAEGQTGVAAPSHSSTTHYFLIDASGSMSSKMDAAENRVETLLSEIKVADPSAPVSRTYFRTDPEIGEASCSIPIEIAPAVPAAESTAVAQVARGSTPLGAALDAALSRAGRGPARIYIVSDGSQTQSCGQDICTVASDRLPRPGVSVEFVPVGNIEADDSDRLGCIGAAQTARVASAPNSQPSEEHVAAWWALFARATWIITLALAAVSAIVFGLHYSRDASKLETKIKKGISPEAENSANVESSEFAKPSWWGRVFLLIATALFLSIWLCPAVYFSVARGEALSNLDTEFGAAVFLASSLSLAGWSASQYWRFFEARRDYFVATNRAEMEKRSRDRRDKERLLDAYNRDRQAIMLYSYESDRRRIASRLNIAADDVRLEKLVAHLVGRAVGADKQVDDVTQVDLDNLSKFRALFVRFSMDSLVSALKDAKAVSENAATNLQSLLSSDSGRTAEQLGKLLDDTLSELEQA